MIDYTKPEYISPSALMLYNSNPEEYFLKYLAKNRPPRLPQTHQMAVGSAFDAYVKAYIARKLWGKAKDSEFNFDMLFEKQVESQNRDDAIGQGANCFQQYRTAGVLDRLMRMLEASPVEPRMEFSEGNIPTSYAGNFAREVTHGDSTVIVLGKPDLHFQTPEAWDFIIDWKVNGYFSAAAPTAGYLMLNCGWDISIEPYLRNHGKCHRDCTPWFEGGIDISAEPNLELKKPDWGLQLVTYTWVAGVPVGGNAILGIHQLACKQAARSNYVCVSIAEHQHVSTPDFQKRVFLQYVDLWRRIQESGHIFKDKDEEANIERMQTLSKQANAYSTETPEDEWFMNAHRRHRPW